MERMVRDVLRDVLAAGAVAARGGGDEAAVLVDERAGEAVDLRLADHGEVGALDDVRRALVPGAEAVGVEGVGEREQRHAVLDDAEGLDGGAADALGGGVGRDQLGVAALRSRAARP